LRFKPARASHSGQVVSLIPDDSMAANGGASKQALFRMDSEVTGSLLDDESPERKLIIEEGRRQAVKVRRAAVVAGVDVITGGQCQDIVYGALNLISTGLVAAQFVVNLVSLFGGAGCNAAKEFKLADIWFFAQLFLNGLATVGQLTVWVLSSTKSVLFWCNWSRFPNSKFATSGDPKGTFLRMKLEDHCQEEYHAELCDLDEEDVREAWKTVQENLKDEPFPIAFKQDMKSLAFNAGMQNSLTSFRAIIGAIGAILEPTLNAYAAFNSVHHATAAVDATRLVELVGAIAEPSLNASAAFNSVSLNASAAFNSLGNATAAVETIRLVALAKCEGLRQTSAAGSGIIAAIGLKQSQMKSAYARLVMLDQLRDDRQTKNISPADLERFDAALESEVMDIVGPEGKRMVAFMSGKPSEPGQ